MSWLLLVLAGFAEVAWAGGLNNTAGFTRLAPSLFALATMVLSVYLLSLALRSLPLGTACAMWVGIVGLKLASDV
jgi:quaternary ammonium compound-resistance protein SugE